MRIHVGPEAGNKLPRIHNIMSNINVWNFRPEWTREQKGDRFVARQTPWVRIVQFMSATGGEPSRDLFINPADASVLNDYDFSPLVAACRRALAEGLLPHIKTGSVPMKFCKNAKTDVFGTNVLPPDDYRVYADYIHAMAGALAAAFDRETVAGWRFGCMTEYENREWFSADSDPEATKLAYFMLYDYTVDALTRALGPEVCVGAHSMSCVEGLWDECEFIEHCAVGPNYATGANGTRLCFLTVSYYDREPGKMNGRTLTETVNILRDKAVSVGLRGLFYGVDEGRILNGTDGKPLITRAVGHPYQAASDAMTYHACLDAGIDYFSSWGYASEGIFGGLPTPAMQTAALWYRLCGKNRLPLRIDGETGENGARLGAVAADSDGELCVFAYSFEPDTAKTGSEPLEIHVMGLPEGRYTVTRCAADAKSNWFLRWDRLRDEAGIPADGYSWSRESCTVPVYGTPEAMEAQRALYARHRGEFARIAETPEQSFTADAGPDGLTFSQQIDKHSAVLYIIKGAGRS